MTGFKMLKILSELPEMISFAVIILTIFSRLARATIFYLVVRVPIRLMAVRIPILLIIQRKSALTS